MTSPDRDYDDVVRRAFHAMADPIEPAGDGLARIRRRLETPRLQRQGWLILNECADLATVIYVRSEPYLDRLRSGVLVSASAGRAGLATAVRAARSGLDAAATAARERLAGLRRTQDGGVADYFPEPGRPVPRRRAPSHRFGGRSYGRAGGMGSTLAWVRPALAVTSVVVVVAAGAFGLTRLRQTIIDATYGTSGQGTNPAAHRPAGGSNKGHGQRITTGGHSHSQSRVRTGNSAPSTGTSPGTTPCSSSSPRPDSSPSPGPSTSPPATPSQSPTPSPTVTSPTPSPTASQASQATPGASAATAGTVPRDSHTAAVSAQCRSSASASPSSPPVAAPTSSAGTLGLSVPQAIAAERDMFRAGGANP